VGLGAGNRLPMSQKFFFFWGGEISSTECTGHRYDFSQRHLLLTNFRRSIITAELRQPEVADVERNTKIAFLHSNALQEFNQLLDFFNIFDSRLICSCMTL